MTMKTLLFQRLMTTYLSRRSLHEAMEFFNALEPYEQAGVLQIFDQQMQLYNALYDAIRPKDTEEENAVG